MRAHGATYAAMEASSHALALDPASGAFAFRGGRLHQPDPGPSGLPRHDEPLRRGEGAALLRSLGPGGRPPPTSAIPSDEAWPERVRAPLCCVSCQPDIPADIASLRCTLGAGGIEALVRTPAGEVTLASRLIGEHNLENLLVALGIAHALELEMPRAAAALSEQAGVPGRLERCDAPGDDIVAVVDYAHTPDAPWRVLLGALRAVSRGGKLWCVFGCGGDRDPTKRAPMGEAVARGADLAVVTSDNPRSEDPSAIAEAVVRGVRAAGREPIVELDRRKAIDLAVRSASAGDVVLVAGKGHEDYQVVGNVVNPFDDRIETRRALEERRQSRGGI